MRLIRFFLLLRLQPAYALVILAASTALGVWMTVLSPGELDSGLGLLLFVQMFVASSGFVSRASSGHFDPLLLAGRSRVRAAAAHWAASVLPGAAGWTVIAAVGIYMGSPGAMSALVGRRAVAWVVVSALGWVFGYRLPRGAGGLAWMTVLIAMLVRHDSPLVVSLFDSAGGGGLRQFALVLFCPFILIGNRPFVPASLLGCAAGACAVVVCLTCRWTTRLDVRLVERS